MATTSMSKKQLVAVGIVCFALLAWWLGGNGLRSKFYPSAEAAEQQPDEVPIKYLGANYCARCHTDKGQDSNEYVLLNEYKTWHDKDKHSQAYQKLEGARAQRMGELLKINVTKDDRCLNCHAANVPKDLRYEPMDPNDKRRFNIKDGVSCDACHGPSLKWIGPHSIDTWRKVPMEKKEALGMRDVRDPVKRSKLCISCHVGNVAEGKVVTHDMYAAGHPPLPSFEIANFSAEMPRHWRYQKEKSAAIQKLLKVDPAEHEQTKLAVIGNAMALRATADLLAHQAKLGARAEESKPRWPELAQFDCYACHHELKTPSWRQERGYTGRPGRPPMRTWPLSTALLAIHYADNGDRGELARQFNAKRKELDGVLDARPFGKAADVVPAATDLVQSSEGLVSKLLKQKYDQAGSLRLLRHLTDLAAKGIPDYDAARQMAWTFKVIYGELDPKPANHAKVQETLKALGSELQLDLPSGTGKDITGTLAYSLQRLNDYQPSRVQKLFKELSELLRQK
jgi:hypothetical protein